MADGPANGNCRRRKSLIKNTLAAPPLSVGRDTLAAQWRAYFGASTMTI
jgi:hypothetical protein